PGADVPSGANWVSTGGTGTFPGTCTVNGKVINAFPDLTQASAHSLTFNYHHIYHPAGTYYCLFCDGARNDSTEVNWGDGWNNDGIGYELKNMVFNVSNATNTFAYYSQSGDIHNSLMHSSFEDIGYNGAGVFYDGSEAPTTSAAPARIVLDHDNMNFGLIAD